MVRRKGSSADTEPHGDAVERGTLALRELEPGRPAAVRVLLTAVIGSAAPGLSLIETAYHASNVPAGTYYVRVSELSDEQYGQSRAWSLDTREP